MKGKKKKPVTKSSNFRDHASYTTDVWGDRHERLVSGESSIPDSEIGVLLLWRPCHASDDNKQVTANEDKDDDVTTRKNNNNNNKVASDTNNVQLFFLRSLSL